VKKVILILLAFSFVFLCGCASESKTSLKFNDESVYSRKTDLGKYLLWIVSVDNFQDTTETWQAIEDHAKHGLYWGASGNMSTVFFFKKGELMPDVTTIGENFDAKYNSYCIAGYWKYPQGNDQFTKYPLK